MDEQKCLFCEIVNNTISSLKIYENESVFGVLNIKPSTKGQVLIITKKHHSFLNSMSEKESNDLMNAIKSISTVISQVFQCSGINVIYSMGGSAGQRIPHVSVDLIPRYANDSVVIEFPESEINEQELYENQRLIIKAFQDSTIDLLVAIKEGKIEVSDEVREQALKTLERINSEKSPRTEKTNKIDIMALEDELGKL